ncbi:MAG: hypothetical protein WAO98_01535, partial [Alphaproteobacteria bacterium]
LKDTSIPYLSKMGYGVLGGVQLDWLNQKLCFILTRCGVSCFPSLAPFPKTNLVFAACFAA